MTAAYKGHPWPRVPLHSVLDRFEAGKSPLAQDRPAGPNEWGVIKVSAVTWGEFDPQENKALLADCEPTGWPTVAKGDLLISRANTTELVGAVVLVKDEHPNLLLCDKTLRLVLKTDLVDAGFLKYAMRTQSVRQHFERCASGTSGSMRNLSQDKIAATEIPLPPLAEQRRIAGILDQADELRAKRRAALAQLDELTQAIFLDMFGDPVLNSIEWPSVQMSDAVVGKYGIKAGPFGSSLKKEDYTTSGYRIYGQEQVIGGRFDIGDYYIGEHKFQQLKSCAVAEDDLLVSLVGSFGKVLIVPAGIEPGIINPRLLKITPNQTLVTPDFLASLLQHPTVQSEFQRLAHGGTMGILNAGLLKQLPVILPPIELQHEFARRVTAVETLKTAHRASLAELDALFASLQHRAFRGEL